MAIDDLYEIFLQYLSVQTDTRKLQPGDLFFALKGPNFNGNRFAQQALDAGAAYVITDEPSGINDDRIILVEDALKTLQALAKYHRNQFTIPFIAITGSNGKTTTKELLHAILSRKYTTYTTEGNLNNHIGVPLTILKIRQDAEMAVIEMGANHMGEIASYCAYAQPTHGLITNIGKAHLEGFGSAENIKKGKGELFQYIIKNKGTLFVNTDDPAITSLIPEAYKTIEYGSQSARFSGTITQSDPYINVRMNGFANLEIHTHLVGAYNLPNILAAVSVGSSFDISPEEIKSAIEKYEPTNSRSQLIKKGTNTIILDAYNANPGSMHAAIANFANMSGENKILILGDMKELGKESEKEHKQLINLIDQYSWKQVLLVGENFSETKSKYAHFKNAQEALASLKETEINNTLVLIKGSRSMQMEQVLQAF